jgi:hypothetical protein
MEVIIPNAILYSPVINTILKLLDHSAYKINNDTLSIIINISSIYTNMIMMTMYLMAFEYMSKHGHENGFYYDRKKKLIYSSISLFVSIVIFMIEYKNEKKQDNNDDTITARLKYFKILSFFTLALYKIFNLFKSRTKIKNNINYSSLSKTAAILMIIPLTSRTFVDIYELMILNAK